MMRHKMLGYASGFVGAFLASLLILSVDAMADGDAATDDVPKYVPYKGTLTKNGDPFDGVARLRFEVYDGAASAAAAWSETQALQVSNGHFEVLLGADSAQSVSDLATVLTGADDVYLAITLETGGGDVPLGDRKRFFPVPYALWAITGTEMVVEGAENDGAVAALVVRSDGGTSTLLIDGNEIDSVNGPLSLNAQSGQPIEHDGVVGFTDELRFEGDATLGDGGVAIRNNADDSFTVGPDGGFAGGIRIDGQLRPNDGSSTLTTEGPTTVQGALKLNAGLFMDYQVMSDGQGCPSDMIPIGAGISCADDTMAPDASSGGSCVPLWLDWPQPGVVSSLGRLICGRLK